ncbi:hypothetical protein P7B02_11640 [Caulobacter segnis]|uniref:hypothetical protein n=1 Tax=Caulobacter segnis TaxID=88688 RepID=UPI00240F23DE|nr:hypothetical protein [Caulobacter segnis]MDG2522194.1 hypothetical protein [Caulobacter segnis]
MKVALTSAQSLLATLNPRDRADIEARAARDMAAASAATPSEIAALANAVAEKPWAYPVNREVAILVAACLTVKAAVMESGAAALAG